MIKKFLPYNFQSGLTPLLKYSANHGLLLFFLSTVCEMKQLSDSIFKGVPLSIRSKVKLPELNIFYQQLQEHLCKTSR